MKTEDLKISVEDKVATFTFNRPDKFNATPTLNSSRLSLQVTLQGLEVKTKDRLIVSHKSILWLIKF